MSIRFNILTLFPDFFKVPFSQGILGQACQKGLIQYEVICIRNFSQNSYGSVDDRPFGGGDGMVISYEPLKEALQSISHQGHVVYLTPQGRKWNHSQARKWAKEKKTISLICGRYAGVDSRFVDQYVDEEISIGDYILSGGEAAGLVVIESVSRFVPGVLGCVDSSDQETFETDLLLEHPQWTKPKHIQGYKIPDVFFSGHHEKIKQARYYLSLLQTHLKRPDLLRGIHKENLPQAVKWASTLSEEEKKSCQLLS